MADLDTLVTLGGIVVAAIVAAVFGDRAGARASIEFQKKEAEKARITRLEALRNEVARIRKLVAHGASGKSCPAKLPTAAFETAFISAPYDLDYAERLVEAATEYIATADAFNARIDDYMLAIASVYANPPTGSPYDRRTSLDIKMMCTDTLPPKLDELEASLVAAIEQSSGANKKRKKNLWPGKASPED